MDGSNRKGGAIRPLVIGWVPTQPEVVGRGLKGYEKRCLHKSGGLWLAQYYNQDGPMYVSKYQMRYLNRKYMPRRDATPIPITNIPAISHGLILFRLSGRSR